MVIRPDPPRQHLAAVVDAFLSTPRDPAGKAAAGRAAPAVFVAAPGASDTAAVLASLYPATSDIVGHDLGGAIGTALPRLERGDAPACEARTALLVWCPRGREGLSLMASMALGRLGALLLPARLTVLWFAGSGRRSSQAPAVDHCRRAKALATVAVPEAAVALHCVGWIEDPHLEIADLARRFA